MTEKLHLNDKVLSSVGKVIVDTSELSEGGYETMVFSCKVNGTVDYSSPLSEDKYETEEDARKGHVIMVRKWKV